MSPEPPTLLITEPGWASSVQDLGRPGLGHLGLGGAGTVDVAGMGRVNRAIGNDHRCAIIETGGGLVVRALRPVTLMASTWNSPTTVMAGESQRFPVSHDRRWIQVAVAGGVFGHDVLGSLSADTRACIEPVPLGAGAMVSVGSAPQIPPADLSADTRETHAVRVWPGPRQEYVVGDALTTLCERDVAVGEGSRVGVRLLGPRFTPSGLGELPSEGLVPGAIQIPHDGSPIVMGPDHPVTGGYPVVAVVDPRDLWVIWTAPAGAQVRFVDASRLPLGSSEAW